MTRHDEGKLQYGLPRGEDDRKAYASACSQAFAQDLAGIETWHDTAGHENQRVIIRAGKAIGGLVTVPMGQFFGGERLSMMGVAGVAIAPEHRGSGAARALMHGAISDFKQQGFAISTLYGSSTRFYRGLGYERAGGQYKVEASLGTLPRQSSRLTMRPATVHDDSEIQAIYRERAQREHGFLDRGPYLWQRIREPRGKTCHGFVIEGTDCIDGYLYVARAIESHDMTLSVVDWGARTLDAFQRLLKFFSGEFALGKTLVFKTGPAADPLVLALAERHYELQLIEHWMLRVLDVKAAFEGRHYVSQAHGALDLAVEDNELPDNHGNWRFEFEAGRCRVRPGGSGTIRCRATALAPLLTGSSSPHTLALTGQVEGTSEALATLGGLVAAPAPAILDFF